jgi:MoaA/NifB/PqqE/SkfB family radical SAM enzyme
MLVENSASNVTNKNKEKNDNKLRKLLRSSPYFWEYGCNLNLYDRKKKGLLTFILINQPPLCDLRCKRCFMPYYRRKSLNNILTLEENVRILKEAKDLGVLSLELSGEGEPLLSPILWSLIKHAFHLNISVTLITNGHSITEDQIRFARDHDVTLVFSLHTLNKEIFERDNRILGSFARVMRNIELASKIYDGTKEELNGYEIYRIATHAVVQADNIADLEDLRKFCHAHNMYYSVAPLAMVGCAVEHPEIWIKQNGKYEKYVEYGDSSIILSKSSEEEYGRKVCGTCAYGISIGYDGSLLFDAHAGYELGSRFGNIREFTLAELFKREKIMVESMFRHIKGFCPVRDSLWPQFLKFALEARSWRDFLNRVGSKIKINIMTKK